MHFHGQASSVSQLMHFQSMVLLILKLLLNKEKKRKLALCTHNQIIQQSFQKLFYWK